VRLRIGLALATVYVVWGSTYFGMAVAIRSLPPFLMSSARFLVAGSLLYAWAYRGARPTRREVGAAAIAGSALLVLGNGGIAWAEQRVDTGVAALLVGAMPLWLALQDRVAFGRRLAFRQALGVAVGLFGVIVLVDPAGSGIDLVGALACLGACFAWAAGSLYSRRAPLPSTPLRAASLQMLTAGIGLALLGTATGEEAHIGAPTAASLGALAYLIVVGSIVAFTSYGWLLRNAPTPLVATYAYVNPVVAVLLGWAFNGEHVGARTAVAGAAIVTSVALTVSGRARPRAPVAPIFPVAQPTLTPAARV
jgi:drug/metabolite transporter (DMT)-like permease